MITESEKEIAEKVIRLHDGKSFSVLQELSMPPLEPDEENRITEQMYLDVCKALQAENGELETIEFIERLDRVESKLTLWKAKYSKSHYKVFWAVGFDCETLKVQDVLVQW